MLREIFSSSLWDENRLVRGTLEIFTNLSIYNYAIFIIFLFSAQKEFDDLCFDFGIELDEVVCVKLFIIIINAPPVK